MQELFLDRTLSNPPFPPLHINPRRYTKFRIDCVRLEASFMILPNWSSLNNSYRKVIFLLVRRTRGYTSGGAPCYLRLFICTCFHYTHTHAHIVYTGKENIFTKTGLRQINFFYNSFLFYYYFLLRSEPPFEPPRFFYSPMDNSRSLLGINPSIRNREICRVQRVKGLCFTIIECQRCFLFPSGKRTIIP